MDDISKIGETRKRLGFTQNELAKLAGVSQSLIAKIESASIDPAYSKVKSIFEALERELSKKDSSKKASDILTKNVFFADENDTLEKVMGIMRTKAISQIPVLKGNEVVGSISDEVLIDMAEDREKMLKKKVRDAMQESFPIVPETSDLDAITNLLHHYKAILIKKHGKIIGIITKSDLIKAIR